MRSLVLVDLDFTLKSIPSGIDDVDWLYKTTFAANSPGFDEILPFELEGFGMICDVTSFVLPYS